MSRGIAMLRSSWLLLKYVSCKVIIEEQLVYFIILLNWA